MSMTSQTERLNLSKHYMTTKRKVVTILNINKNNVLNEVQRIVL